MQQTYAAVQRDLLEANHLSPDLLAQSLSIIGANHVDYADIYVSALPMKLASGRRHR